MNADADFNQTPDPQADVIAYLSDPLTYDGVDKVDRVDTHAAMVFLAGTRAYKLKRAVAYPFMDFSTLAKRRAACLHEIEVNRANAPQIYLNAVPVTCDAKGVLSIDGSGDVVDWVVRMARFDETRTLDRIAEKNPLAESLINALAHEMVQVHQRAPRRKAGPWITDLMTYVDQNAIAFGEHADLFPPDRAKWLIETSKKVHHQIAPLLAARGKAGHIRLCHGDAHLGNIALIDDRPVFFDAIEFDDTIATNDVLYDLAFLLMDLWDRGQFDQANRALNRYLVESRCADHYDGLAALPFFLMLRAAIRAKVTAARRLYAEGAKRAALEREARTYFDAACSFLDDGEPRLVAVGGLSGTGKSTAAAAVAAQIGRAPGAVVLRSDVIRKELLNVPETQHLPSAAYGIEAASAVYEQLCVLAARVLETGHSVVADAVFSTPAERQAIAAVAEAAGCGFAGFWLHAPEEVLAARVTARTGDASDADAEVVRFQSTIELGDMTWTQVDASGPSENAHHLMTAALKTAFGQN